MNAREKPLEGNAGWATVRARCTAATQFVVQTFAQSCKDFKRCEVGPGAEKLEQNEIGRTETMRNNVLYGAGDEAVK